MRESLRERWTDLGPQRRLLGLLALAALGLVSWWWLDKQRQQVIEVEKPRQPDAYFRDLDAERHDETGAAAVRVEARYAEHFEDEPWIHLHDLRAHGANADGEPWQLTAERGRLNDDGTELEARGNVRLRRESGKAAAMLLETESLHVNTKTEVVTSDTTVLISQGASRVRGRGMFADLRNDRLQLQEDVEAYYEK